MSNDIVRFVDELSGEVFVTLNTAKYQFAPRKQPNRQYAAVYHDKVRMLTASLGLTELGALMKLIPHIQHGGDGWLIRRSKRMGVADIAVVTGKSFRQAERHVTTLVKAGVFGLEREGKRHVYRVNPAYVSACNNPLPGAHTSAYQVGLRPLLADLPMPTAGLLYAMTPYMSNGRLAVTRAALAELLGVDKLTVYRALDGLYAAGIVSRGEGYALNVNSELFKGGR